MRVPKVLLFLLAGLACAALAMAAPALAHHGHRSGLNRTFVQAPASYVGITPAALKTAVATGQTPAQLAVAHGKTVAGLTARLTTAGATAINNARAAGRITAAQAQARLAALPAAVQAFVNSTSLHSGGCASGSSATASSARHRG